MKRLTVVLSSFLLSMAVIPVFGSNSYYDSDFQEEDENEDTNGWTDAHWAACDSDFQEEDENEDTNGWTDAHWAAKDRNENYFSKYSSSKQEVLDNLKKLDKNGRSPLHIAFKYHGPDFVMRILNNLSSNSSSGLYHVLMKLDEIYIFNRWHKGKTLLYLAARAGHLELSRFLLLNSSAIWVPETYKGLTPLHAAVLGGNSEILRTMIQLRERLPEKNSSGTNFDPNLLFLAVKNEKKDILEVLLEYSEKFKKKDSAVQTLLHSAAAKGNVEILALLLDRGLDINSLNEEGETPLMVAVKNGYAEVARFLLERSTGFNEKDVTVQKLLHTAAAKGSVEILSLLLDRGLDINSLNNEGETPLTVAVKNGHVEVVGFLLGQRAQFTSDTGQTALHVAIDCDQRKVAEFLVDFAKADNIQIDVKELRTYMKNKFKRTDSATRRFYNGLLNKLK